MLDVTDHEFAAIVARNVTVAGVLRDMGRALVGTNYALVHHEVVRLCLDTSHWGKRRNSAGKVPWAKVLSADSSYKINSRRKAALLREGLLENICAKCGLGPKWSGKSLVLRLDHINGVRNDNRLENLRMLCPNCDSQTDTYCGRNARKPPNTCACGKTIGRKSRTCRDCADMSRPQPTKIDWPPAEDILVRVQESSFRAVAAELGVSDNAVRKHLRVRGMLV